MVEVCRGKCTQDISKSTQEHDTSRNEFHLGNTRRGSAMGHTPCSVGLPRLRDAAPSIVACWADEDDEEENRGASGDASMSSSSLTRKAPSFDALPMAQASDSRGLSMPTPVWTPRLWKEAKGGRVCIQVDE